VVCVSYSAELAKTHANDFRRVVTDPVYQAVFQRMIVSRDTDSEIHTTLRGRRYATSIGGTLTGRGGNLIIIDDPLKPADAVSDVSRQRVIEWHRPNRRRDATNPRRGPRWSSPGDRGWL
jgi:hypothetical protein